MKAKIDRRKYQSDSIQNNIDQLIEGSEKLFLNQGDKVKLNYVKIKSNSDYQKMRESYKEFIETNKDRIFTLKEDKNHKQSIVVFSLKEDITEPKWLFAEPDLILIEKGETYEI